MKNIHVLSTDRPSRLYLTTHEYIFEKGYALSTDECQNKNIYITSDEEIKEEDWVLDLDCIGRIKKADNLIVITSTKEQCWYYKKIILTTDQDLIKDGVQRINDEFLEWFVKNPSCKEVEVEPFCEKLTCQNKDCSVCCQELKYKIIIPKEEQCTCKVGEPYNNACCKIHGSIPKEKPKQDLPIVNGSYGCIIKTKKQEPKQETLEEATERLFKEYSNNTSLSEGHYDYMMDKEDFKQASLEIAKWQQERSYSEEEVLAMLKELEIECVINPRRTEIEEWFKQLKKK